MTNREFERIAMEWMRKHKSCVTSGGWCLPILHDDGCIACVVKELKRIDESKL